MYSRSITKFYKCVCYILSSGQKHSFTFDKVLMPEATQEDVFVEISQLVQSALDGYKVTDELDVYRKNIKNLFIPFVLSMHIF